MHGGYTNNLLSLLEGFTLINSENIARDIANEFRKRRIEKGITREMIAKEAKVSPANVARFEQKALISLSNLIKLAIALGYTSEIHHIFSEQKFSTMDELDLIKKNQGKKKAYRKK